MQVEAVWARGAPPESILTLVRRTRDDMVEMTTKAWNAYDTADGKVHTATQSVLAKRSAHVLRDGKDAIERRSLLERSCRACVHVRVCIGTHTGSA